MDGQENPFPQIWSAKFHEVQKFLSLTGPRLHARLPHRERGLLEEAPQGRPGHDLARSPGRRAISPAPRASGWTRSCSRKLAPPMAVNEPDKEAFIKASAGVYEEFGKQVSGGAELVKIDPVAALMREAARAARRPRRVVGRRPRWRRWWSSSAWAVFIRYVLNSSLVWYDEFASYLLVWLTFYGAVVADYQRAPHRLRPAGGQAGADGAARRGRRGRARRARLPVRAASTTAGSSPSGWATRPPSRCRG